MITSTSTEMAGDSYCFYQKLFVKVLIKSILILLIPTVLFSQSLTKERAETFAHNLFYNSDSLRGYFAESTLEMSERLGIEYEGVKLKCLISNDFDDSIKWLINDNQQSYALLVEDLGEEYSKLKINVNDKSIQFYFKDSLCISSLEYLCRNWVIRESEHFNFVISDTFLFNENNIESLERFLQQAATKLGLSVADMNKLSKEKIIYYFCRDEGEIREVTGYEAKGMYNLAYDAILSTHNTHYHELMHLLVNFRLCKLPLYTHPLLQEGIAVALGGRGGMSGEILLRLGSYLFTSGLVYPSSILTKNEFSELDPSLGYPAAGIFCDFFVRKFGINQFLKLYMNHSGSADDERVSVVKSEEVGDTAGWMEYLEMNLSDNDISIDTLHGEEKIIINNESLKITHDDEEYYFRTNGYVVISSGEQYHDFRSKKFYELIPNGVYRGEKYLIRADDDEVAVYNLFDNEVIDGYFGSLYYPAVSIPKKGNNYFFSIQKRAFDEPLQEMRIEVLHPNVELR